MRPGHLSQLNRLALALAAVVLVTLIWVSWSPTAGLLAATIAGFVVLVSICLWVLPARLVARDTAAAELAPEQRASAVNSARTTLVQGLVGLLPWPASLSPGNSCGPTKSSPGPIGSSSGSSSS
jgi:hypothetical protein